MKHLLFLAVFMSAFDCAHAQVFPETEDEAEVNSNPTIQVPVNRRADTEGMALPPVSRPMPVPPPYREGYRSTPDTTTPEPTIPSAPQPGFPGARQSVVRDNTAQVNLLELFDKAYTGKLRDCSITVRRRRDACEYEVRVSGQVYPFHMPETCSSNQSAALVGCNYGNQRENAACILNQAMMIGYCR